MPWLISQILESWVMLYIFGDIMRYAKFLEFENCG